MTGLSRFYSCYLPNSLVWIAVTLTYTAALFLLILFGRTIDTEIMYIDIEAGQ